jgi:hypothetical protein
MIFRPWLRGHLPCVFPLCRHRALNSDVNDDQKLDQRTIVACLALKGLSPREIHKDLLDTLGHDAVASSSVMGDLREASYLP